MYFIINYLPYVLSAFTIYIFLLAGNKSRNTWLVALASQILWAIWIVATKTWGLLPGTFVLTIVFIRNYSKWRDTGN